MPDAQTQPAAYSAELSVRFEVSADRPATVSVLGFRAAAAGPETDVLGLVDPLAAAAPDQGCVLRDVDLATARWRPAAAPSISRSSAASASAWARARPRP